MFRCLRGLASRRINLHRDCVFGGANDVNHLYIDRGLTVDAL
jgi:hypothetical protein